MTPTRGGERGHSYLLIRNVPFSGPDGAGDGGGETEGGESGGNSGGGSSVTTATTMVAYGSVFALDTGTETVETPIQRTWSGGEVDQNGNVFRGVSGQPLTLSLSGMPRHGAFVVRGIYDYGDNPEERWQVEVAGQQV